MKRMVLLIILGIVIVFLIVLTVYRIFFTSEDIPENKARALMEKNTQLFLLIKKFI